MNGDTTARAAAAARARWGERPPDELRTVSVLLKLSSNEKRRLDAAAAAAGMSRAEFVVTKLKLRGR